MCDVLLRLPLSVFVKLVNITFEVSGLQEFLTHPVRRHYLIRSLPHSIRNKLLFQRKYIFTVHEVATRLAYIGVLQFGPQKLKEKDQVKRTRFILYDPPCNVIPRCSYFSTAEPAFWTRPAVALDTTKCKTRITLEKPTPWTVWSTWRSFGTTCGRSASLHHWEDQRRSQDRRSR